MKIEKPYSGSGPRSPTAGSGFFYGGTMDKKLSLDAIDEKQRRDAAHFFEKHPDKLTEAKQWYKDNGFESLNEALEFASKLGYWQGILYVAYDRHRLDCLIEFAEAVKAGWIPTADTAETIIVRDALEEGRKSLSKKVSLPKIKLKESDSAILQEFSKSTTSLYPNDIAAYTGIKESTIKGRLNNKLIPLGFIEKSDGREGFCITESGLEYAEKYLNI